MFVKMAYLDFDVGNRKMGKWMTPAQDVSLCNKLDDRASKHAELCSKYQNSA